MSGGGNTPQGLGVGWGGAKAASAPIDLANPPAFAAEHSSTKVEPANWVAPLSRFVAKIAALTPAGLAESQKDGGPFSQLKGLVGKIQAQHHDPSFLTLATADFIKALDFCGTVRNRATRAVVPVMCSARRVPATEDPRNIKVIEKLASRAHPLTGGGPGLMEIVSHLDFMARLADLTCSMAEKYPGHLKPLIRALLERTSMEGPELAELFGNCGVTWEGTAPQSTADLAVLLRDDAQTGFSEEGLEYLALGLAMKSEHDMQSIRTLLRTKCDLTPQQIEGLGLEVFGIKLHIPSERLMSRFISTETQLNYFFGRKLPFAKEGNIALVMPGGLGTYEELLELVQQGLNVIVYGEMWKPLVDRMQGSPNREFREASRKLVHYCESVDDVGAALDLHLPDDLPKSKAPGEQWFEGAYGDSARQFVSELLGTKDEIFGYARTLEQQCWEAIAEDADTKASLIGSDRDLGAFLGEKYHIEGPVTAEAVASALGKDHLKSGAPLAVVKAHKLASKACALRLVGNERESLLSRLELDDDGAPKLDLRLLTWAVADVAVASSVQALIPERDGIAVVGSRVSYAQFESLDAQSPAEMIQIQRRKTHLVEEFGRVLGANGNTFVIPNARSDSAPSTFIRAAIGARDGEPPKFIEVAVSSPAVGSDHAIAMIPHTKVAVHSQFGRELAMTKATKGAIFFEGGVNTEALFIEILDGIVTGKIPKSYKIVLVGKEWGNAVVECIKPLVEAKVADVFALDSILVTEDPAEATTFLKI